MDITNITELIPGADPVNKLLLVGMGGIITVLIMLWRKVEAYNQKIEAKLTQTETKLEDCEKQRFDYLRTSLEEATDVVNRLEYLEKRISNNG